MAPKSGLSQAQKLALCVQWIQKSGVAHTLKDLEKALPQVASISGMNLKEYIQMMTDENMIRVEKIGSGNWYWSFLSDEKLRKEQALAKAQSERNKAQATLEELQKKVEEASAAREDDQDEMLMEPGMDRKSMTMQYAVLEQELGGFRTELAAYSDNDPVEVDRRKMKIDEEKRKLDSITDQICNMEGWYKKQTGGDKAQFLMMKKSWYGDEFDDELGGLRDI